MSKRKLPMHIPGSLRAWQTRKRKELDAAIEALDVFALGCAYTPAKDIGVIQSMLRKNRKAVSVKEWKWK